MPMLRSSLVPSLLLLGLAACNVAESEEETLDLDTRPLFYSATETFASGSRVVQGSRVCLGIEAVLLDDTWWQGEDLGQCYAVTMGGEPFEHGRCVALDELGEVLFEYAPQPVCPFDRLASLIVPDRYRLQVIAAGDVQRGQLEWRQEAAAERVLDPGPRGSFPSDWVPPEGEALQLVPGVEVPFPVVLLDATGEHVAWDLEQGRVLESRDGGAAAELAAIPDYAGYYSVSIGEGERSTLTLALPGVELPVAEVVATPADAAASLEIVVGYGAGTEPERWTGPWGARAVVRDAEGRVVLGAPVEWTLVEGHLVTGPLDPDLGTPPEYLALGDDCEPPPAAPQPRRAILRAELGTLVDEVELEWTALPDDGTREEPFEPNPACQRGGEADGLDDRGCGCTTQGTGGSGWLAWAVVLLGVVRRRRRVLPCRPR